MTPYAELRAERTPLLGVAELLTDELFPLARHTDNGQVGKVLYGDPCFGSYLREYSEGRRPQVSCGARAREPPRSSLRASLLTISMTRAPHGGPLRRLPYLSPTSAKDSCRSSTASSATSLATQGVESDATRRPTGGAGREARPGAAGPSVSRSGGCRRIHACLTRCADVTVPPRAPARSGVLFKWCQFT